MSSISLALRTLWKAPSFTLVALVTLALGIGVNTSMYTLMDVLLFRAAPFPEPDRLVAIYGTNPRDQRENFSFVEVEEMRGLVAAAPADGSPALLSLTTLCWTGNAWVEPGKPAEQLTAIDATADLFTTFRVQPLLGRPFTQEEGVPGRNQVALLSHELWQSRFGGDPAVLGRVLRLNAEPVTVIGVMPQSFGYPLLFGKVDLWRPVTMARNLVDDRNFHFFQAIARMAPGVAASELKARLEPLAARWAKDYPKDSTGRGFNVMPLHKANMDSTGILIVWLLMGLAGSVLLIACANLANLQLARATVSARDLAIRAALGASRRRLILHQLAECLVLAVAGGLGGLAVAALVNGAFGRAIRIGDSGDHLVLPIDGRVLGMSFLVSMVAGLAFGLLPAWLASRQDVVTALKAQSRGSTAGRGQRFARQGLIVAEVALALALLAVAGVMIRGFGAMLQKETGWDTVRVLSANFGLPEQSTYDTEDKRRVAIEKLERRLAQIPGAEQTAICTVPPLFGYSRTSPIQIEGQTSEDPITQPRAGYSIVGSGFFATLGIPLREGRLFPADMRADHPPVVVVGETLARKFWPNESAVGKRIGERDKGEVVWREVIGVVRDISFPLNLAHPDTLLQVYKPLVHEPWGYLHVLVRGAAPSSFKEEVRRAVADLDPDLAVQQMYTVPEASARYLHNVSVINDTLGWFALLGLVLAAVGLYGVISNLVAQRTAEFGIRLALGASPTDVLSSVLATGARVTVLGLAVGAGLAWALVRLVSSEMPRMAAPDPVTLALVVGVLVAVALFACYWPARRATKVDPLVALRAE